MAYVGNPEKRARHAGMSKRWSAEGAVGRLALAASLLFLAMAIFGL